LFDRTTQSERDGSGTEAVAEPIALDSVALHWQVLVGRDQRPSGVRLDLQARVGLTPVSASALLESVVRGFVADDALPFPRGLVLLAPPAHSIDAAMAQWSAPRNVLLEVAAADLQDDARVRTLFASRRQGVRQALRLDENKLSRERLQFFQYLVGPSSCAQWAGIPVLALDSQSTAQAQAAYAAGAHALVGWPVAETPPAGSELSPSQRAIFELVRLIRADAEIRTLERVFEAEPVLAYLLLTLANSVAYRRGAPTASLRQAVIAIGYQRLVKWLVLILAVSNKDKRFAPLIFTTLVRGYCMENLCLGTGGQRAEADECFVVGAFSLLDKITGQPLPELMSAANLPAPVTDALVTASGPYAPWLQQVCRMELGQVPGGAGAIETVDADIANKALLRALSAADAMLALI